ncbi:MAG: hypothetical protein COB02_06960 [Candidatus Cloacimonadota bacterium]|nr:MAG: hypothetical protein COB02_06960 [Candidatus Cloacimonadota bacterium]
MLIVSKSNACDPILESLILSKKSINSIDMLFRDFSTRLAQLGQEARNKNINLDTLVYTKLVWLKVYEKYYLHPPKIIKKSHWVKSIDNIAKIIRRIGEQTSFNSFEKTHTNILKIQNILISIYDGSQNKSFYAKTRMIKHLFLLLKKSKSQKLFEDEKMIYQRILIEWQEMKEYFSRSLQGKLKLDEKFKILNVMKLKDYNLKKNEFFKKLEQEYWTKDD